MKNTGRACLSTCAPGARHSNSFEYLEGVMPFPPVGLIRHGMTPLSLASRRGSAIRIRRPGVSVCLLVPHG